MDKQIQLRDTSPEEFYNQSNSCYIRVTFDPSVNGFRFAVRNEFVNYLKEGEELTQGHSVLLTLTRGLVEMGIEHTADVYELGLHAQQQDYMQLNTEDMPEEHRQLMLAIPEGNA